MKVLNGFVAVIVLIFTAQMQAVFADDSLTGQESHFIDTVLGKVACNVDESILVSLVCPSYLTDAWSGRTPCGFDVAKCTEERWQLFLAEHSPVQTPPLNSDDCLEKEGDSETTLSAVGRQKGTVNVGETLEDRLRHRFRAREQQFEQSPDSAVFFDATPHLWLAALQAAYVMSGCATNTESAQCQQSDYAKYLADENPEAVAMRNIREAHMPVHLG